MNFFNQYTGVLLVVSFPLKAILQYMHLNKFGGENNQKSSNYLFAFPIIDKHKSIYKLVANVLVLYQYLIITIALIENRELLYHIWETWSEMP